MTAGKPEISTRDRLIFALDVPRHEDARQLIRTLGDAVGFYKLGLEVFLSGQYFELMEELKGRGKKVFADLKLFDIPATVAAAVRQLARHEVDFCTVHGNDSMLRAAAEAKGDMRVLAVTALTSLDQGDLDDLGFQCDARTLVLSRARPVVVPRRGRTRGSRPAAKHSKLAPVHRAIARDIRAQCV